MGILPGMEKESLQLASMQKSAIDPQQKIRSVVEAVTSGQMHRAVTSGQMHTTRHNTFMSIVLDVGRQSDTLPERLEHEAAIFRGENRKTFTLGVFSR